VITTNLRPNRHREPELNITPLIDVVFLLLIFFMVSTTFEHFSEIRIELPDGSSEAAPKRPNSIDIVIDRDGHYYVNRKKLEDTELGTLRKILEQIAGERGEQPVVINADASTPHQAVITAMDAASRAGLSQITFATAGGAE